MTFKKDHFRTHIISSQYKRDIERYSLLSREDEIELAALVSQGSREALEKLICSNLRLVVAIAHDYKTFGDFQDLVACGNIGLMIAAERFDPFRGKFSSYACFWIKQKMRVGPANDNVVKIPINQVAKIMNLYRMMGVYGYKVSSEVLAKKTGYKASDVVRLRNLRKRAWSLDDPDRFVDPVGFLGKSKCIGTEGFYISAEVKQDALAELEKLDTRMHDIIVLRMGLSGKRPRTLEELSASYGCTRERVRQIQNRGLKIIKDQMKSNLIGIMTR